MRRQQVCDIDGGYSREELRWRHYKDRGDSLRIWKASNAAVEAYTAFEEEVKVNNPPYVISYTTKKKISRIHITGGCWRRPGFDYLNYEYIYDLEDLKEMVPMCRDCEKGRKEEPPSSDSSSSSTDTDEDTEEEKKASRDKAAEESQVVNTELTKQMLRTLQARERPRTRGRGGRIRAKEPKRGQLEEEKQTEDQSLG